MQTYNRILCNLLKAGTVILSFLSILSLSCANDNSIESIPSHFRSKVVFTGMHPDSLQDKHSHGIFIIDLQTSEYTRIGGYGDTVTFPDGWRESVKYPFGFTKPRWSPNGKNIACELTYGYSGNLIVVMNSDGTDKRIMGANDSLGGGYCLDPEWSPSGRYLMFMKGFWGMIFTTTIISADGAPYWNIRLNSPEGYLNYNGDTLYPIPFIRWGRSDEEIFAPCIIGVKPPNYFDTTWWSLPTEIFSFNSRTGTISSKITENNFSEYCFEVSRDGTRFLIQRGGAVNNDSLIIFAANDSKRIIVPIGDGDDVRFSNDNDKITFTVARRMYIIDLTTRNILHRIGFSEGHHPDLFVEGVGRNRH